MRVWCVQAATTIVLLLLLQAAPAQPPRQPAPWNRVYHKVAIADVPRTTFTHVEVEGRVTLVRREEDGDIHIRLEYPPAEGVQARGGRSAGKFVVVEVIPEISLTIPKVGDLVRVRGISRYDGQHKWSEVHPAEAIEILPPVPTPTPEKK